MYNTLINNKYIVSFIAGCINTLSFAPFFLFPFVIISFMIIIFLLDNIKSIREIIIIGWLYGFGNFVTGLYWIIYALLTDSDEFLILSPLSNIILPGFLAIYPCVTLLVSHIMNKHFSNYYRYIILAVNWTSIEYARSILFSGFPWNLTGYTVCFSESLSQIISIIGIYGCSCLIIIISSAIYNLFYKRYIYSMIILAVTSSIYLYGNQRLNNIIEYEDVNLLLVQGNISQHDKLSEDLRAENLSTYMNLSHNKPSKTYIIWPESAVPYYPIENESLLKYLSSILSKDSLLITGAISSRDSTNSKLSNSIVFINASGRIIASYDKTHLVPFTEYVPFRSIAPDFIEKISFGFGDFEKGIGPITLQIDGLLKLSPLICYESIFPSISVDRNNHPNWILNVTNDGWFGKSIGPYQHFMMSKTRAIEQGIPMVRVANTGISSVIDPYGRILSYISLGSEGVIESKLPKKLDKRTIYSQYGDLIIFIFVVISYIIFGLRYFRNKQFS